MVNAYRASVSKMEHEGAEWLSLVGGAKQLKGHAVSFSFAE
jgi:hypothetical protein